MQVRTASKRIPYLVDADFSDIQAQFLEPKKRGDSKESSWKEWQVSISVQQLGKERTYTDSQKHESTDSTKINRPGHNIRMYRTNFRQPTAHVQRNIFGKTLIEVCSLHLYASFGTFCIQIGQLFAPKRVFKHSEDFRN